LIPELKSACFLAFFPSFLRIRPKIAALRRNFGENSIKNRMDCDLYFDN